MSDFFQLIILTLTGGVASILGALLIIALRDKASGLSQKLTGFAAGVLISVGVLDLLAEAFEHGSEAKEISLFVLFGILLVFILEKSGLWFHHHDGEHGKQKSVIGILLGDMLHNFIDGFAVGATFLISKEAGIATAIAVALHELPKEMADFTVYLRAGYSNLKTLFLNLASSVVAVIGGLIAFSQAEWVENNESKLLALTAGMFIFVALADLIPEMHEEIEKQKQKRGKLAWILVFVLGLGVGIISSNSH